MILIKYSTPRAIDKISDFPSLGQAFLRAVRPRLGHGNFLIRSRETSGDFPGPLQKCEGFLDFSIFDFLLRSVNDS